MIEPRPDIKPYEPRPHPRPRRKRAGPGWFESFTNTVSGWMSGIGDVVGGCFGALSSCFCQNKPNRRYRYGDYDEPKSNKGNLDTIVGILSPIFTVIVVDQLKYPNPSGGIFQTNPIFATVLVVGMVIGYPNTVSAWFGGPSLSKLVGW